MKVSHLIRSHSASWHSEPIHPFGGGQFDVIDRAPRRPRFDQLGFIEAVDRFGEGVVEARPDRADAGLDPGFGVVTVSFKVEG